MEPPANTDIFWKHWQAKNTLIFRCKMQDLSEKENLNKPKTAKLAQPVSLKIVIRRELLMFGNFKFFEKISYTQCLQRKNFERNFVFQKTNDGAFHKTFGFFS